MRVAPPCLALSARSQRPLGRAVGVLSVLLGFTAAAPVVAEPVERVVPDLAALSRLPVTVLPRPPAWTAGSGKPTCTVDDIVAELRAITPKTPKIIHQASIFVRPDHEWMVAYVRWFRKFGTSLNLHFEDELFDCDKFARCFVAYAGLIAQRGGESGGSLCVGWAVVDNQRSFGGIEAGGGHAVVIADTSQGLFVVEPQTATMTPLGDYPNRDGLAELNL